MSKNIRQNTVINMQLQRGSRCHLFLAPTQLDELAHKLATGDFGQVRPLKQKQLLCEKWAIYS